MNGVQAYAQTKTGPVDELIEKYRYLVHQIAHQLGSRLPPSIGVQDLVQCGVLRLIEVVGEFVPTKGASFETYARLRIRGAMLDEIRAHSWAPRSVFKKARDISAGIAALESELGRAPEASEIAARLEISMDEYHQALNNLSATNLLSLDELLEGSGQELAPRSGLASSMSTEDDVALLEVQKRLANAIRRLSEREQQILNMHYQEEFSFRTIADILGVSAPRISQLHTQALLRLRALL
jgi:RNA polymerase sigma factor FliA